MKRGTIVTVALPGAYGKPRPALVIQSDFFDEHPSVTVLPITSDLRDTPLFRVRIAPTPENGLYRESEIMIDKTATIPREKIGYPMGIADGATMRAVDRCLSLFLGIAQ